MRKCNYRNCQKDISHMRPNAKFCNRSCKGCENKYVRRRKAFIENALNAEMKKVNEYKMFVNLLKGADKN